MPNGSRRAVQTDYALGLVIKLQITQRNLRPFLLVSVEGCLNIVAMLQVLGEETLVGCREREGALSWLMLGEGTGCTERNILNAGAESQKRRFAVSLGIL